MSFHHPIAAERARVLLGAAAFLLVATVGASLLRSASVPPIVAGIWALALVVGVFGDRQLKLTARRGLATWWAPLCAAVYLAASVAGFVVVHSAWVSGCFLVAAALASAGGVLGTRALYSNG